MGHTHALTMGTTMTTIKTQIPIPMMIRIFMSFHLITSVCAARYLTPGRAGHTTSACGLCWRLFGIPGRRRRGCLGVSAGRTLALRRGVRNVVVR